MRHWLLLGLALSVSPALAQPSPQQHGLFDTNAADNPLGPQGTPASPYYTRPVPGDVAPASTANQGTTPWQDNIAQWGGVSVNIGQQVRAASIPVTLASDQPAVPISGNVGLLAGSALAGGFNLYVNGALNTAGNPLFAQITNFPATQNVAINGASVTAGQGAGSPAASMVQVGCRYNQGGTILSDGQAQIAQCAENGAQRVSQTPSSNPFSGLAMSLGATCGVNQSGCILKASASNFFDASASPSAAASLVLIDSATVPASGATLTPKMCAQIPANGNGSLSAGIIPIPATNGWVVVLTSVACSAASLTYTPVTGFLLGRAK